MTAHVFFIYVDATPTHIKRLADRHLMSPVFKSCHLPPFLMAPRFGWPVNASQLESPLSPSIQIDCSTVALPKDEPSSFFLFYRVRSKTASCCPSIIFDPRHR